MKTDILIVAQPLAIMQSRSQPVSRIFVLVSWLSVIGQVACKAIAHDPELDVTYRGVCYDGIETFYSIPYGQDTSGENRFKPPRPAVPAKGSTINAVSKGPACPQPKGDAFNPLYLSNITEVSEDCLHLNVYRAQGTASDAKLPVSLYIHGGSFYIGSKDELTIQPGGLIQRSVEMGRPIIYVTINYRLGGMRAAGEYFGHITDSLQYLVSLSRKLWRKRDLRTLV